MGRSTIQLLSILDAKTTTGSGTSRLVTDFRHVVLQVVAAVGTTANIRIQGSMSDSPPDFSAAQSETNHWDFIAAYDYNDPSSIIVGDTGISFTAVSVANSCLNLLVNIDMLQWINVQVNTISAGSVTVKMASANDTEG